MKDIEAQILLLAEKLKEKRWTIVTAESCTGGGLSFHISNCPECSPLLERGYVTYSNHSKQQALNVLPETLQLHGAVSKDTVIEMAEGALKNSCAQISIATTGYTGASDEKSKISRGIVWLGCAAMEKKTQTKMINIKGARKKFCSQTILQALKFLVKFIES